MSHKNCQSIECRKAIEERWDKTKKVFHIRFWNRVKVGDVGECWEHPKQGSKKYPSVTIDNQKTMSAHRMAYTLFYGDIPDRMMVCHKCDNPPCCNPYHLFLGTNSDNQLDSSRKGRMPNKQGPNNPMFGRTGINHPSFGKRGKNLGESHTNAKMKESDIILIREMHASKSFSNRDIAQKFNITKHNVYAIVSRKTWKHVG